jgi:hypothetical protein
MKAKTIILAVLGIIALCGPVWALNGMVSYWKFDDGSGTTAYDLFGDNHGTVYGAQWTSGQVEGALTFDGVGDYVDIPDTVKKYLETSYTFSVWIKPKTIFGVHSIAAYRRSTYDIGYQVLLQLQHNNSDVQFIVGSLGNNAIASYPDALTTNTWYHVAGIRKENVLNVYINGVSGIPDSQTFGKISPDNFKIGAIHCCSQVIQSFFDGTIDEVAIYDRALSAEEIQQLYENGLAGYGYPVDAKIIATNKIECAIAKKLETLEKVNATLEQEWAAYEALQELLESGDYGDLSKGDIVTAMQKTHSSIQHEEQSIDALEKSIEKLRDALEALGWQPPPEPQPVSHWKFDEGEGTIAYDSVGTNDGTIYGATWTTGQINGALSFDGADDYLEVADDDSLDFTKVYAGAWINTSSDGLGAVVNKRDEKINVDWQGFVLFVEAGYVRFGADDGPNNSYTPISGTKIDDGEWHYIGGRFDVENVTTYVDGVENTEAYASSVTGNLNNDDKLRIGAQWNGYSKYVHFFDGSIDEVKIYDQALSDQQIQRLYHNGSAGW